MVNNMISRISLEVLPLVDADSHLLVLGQEAALVLLSQTAEHRLKDGAHRIERGLRLQLRRGGAAKTARTAPADCMISSAVRSGSAGACPHFFPQYCGALGHELRHAGLPAVPHNLEQQLVQHMLSSHSGHLLARSGT